MSSGVVHTKTTMITALLAGTASSFLGADMGYSIIGTFGIMLGVILSPDLDLSDTGFHGLYILRVLFGEYFSRVFQAYWTPYSMIVRHRSWISHAPIISTAIRLMYLFAPLVIVLIILGYRINEDSIISLIVLFSGIALSDCMHIAMDVLSTGIKNAIRRLVSCR